MKRVALLAALVFGAVAVAGGQQPSGQIAGVLINDAGRPVARGRVSLSGVNLTLSRSVLTDERGAFSFANLPAGQFTLSASRPGLLDSQYGQKRPGSGRAGTAIVLAAGQHLDKVELRIPKAGVITGVVVDEQGEPSFGATVRAYRYVMRSGERALQNAGTAQADDRGVYRLMSLLPGEYVISATARDDGGDKMMAEMAVVEAKQRMAVATASASETAIREAQRAIDQLVSGPPGGPGAEMPATGFATIYYPGTMAGANAAAIAIDISEEKSGIDLRLPIVPLGTVSGNLVAPDGSVPSNATVALLDANTALVPGLPTRSTRLSQDGKFQFTGVPQGAYTLLARAIGSASQEQAYAAGFAVGRAAAAGPPDPLRAELSKIVMTSSMSTTHWAMLDVTADRNAQPVTVTLQPTMTVSGRVEFDEGPAPADLTKTVLTIAPVNQTAFSDLLSAVRPAVLDAEGRFTMTGLPPGRYRLSLTKGVGIEGWSMKSVTAGAVDTLDVGLEVKPGENISGVVATLTRRMATVTGMMQGPSGSPTTDYTVVIFPADTRFWLPQARRVQAMRPGTDGRFSFQSLPGGDYRIAAVTDVEQGQWFDPAFLRQLVGASMSFSLADGERKTQDVRAAR